MISGYFLRSILGRVIAQAVSRWLLTAAARVRARVTSCGICGGQSGTGAGFLRLLRFPLPIIPPITSQSISSIIWGWYNRPVVASLPSGLSLNPLRIIIQYNLGNPAVHISDTSSYPASGARQNLPVKTLLISDNAPGRSSEEQLKSRDGLTEVMFLLPNYTPLLQPMDQNVIQFVKSHYRKSLPCSVISQNDDIIQCLKEQTSISHMHGKMYLLIHEIFLEKVLAFVSIIFW
jgi:hypothetical protein